MKKNKSTYSIYKARKLMFISRWQVPGKNCPLPPFSSKPNTINTTLDFACGVSQTD